MDLCEKQMAKTSLLKPIYTSEPEKYIGRQELN